MDGYSCIRMLRKAIIPGISVQHREGRRQWQRVEFHPAIGLRICMVLLRLRRSICLPRMKDLCM